MYDAHTDWVNDVVLLGDEATLVTGRSSFPSPTIPPVLRHVLAFSAAVSDPDLSPSSDNTLKMWNVQSEKCVATYGEHTDYVKALAYARGRGLLASAGLDREVIIWDLEASAQPVATMSSG